jgi:hypothetical protein
MESFSWLMKETEEMLEKIAYKKQRICQLFHGKTEFSGWAY